MVDVEDDCWLQNILQSLQLVHNSLYDHPCHDCIYVLDIFPRNFETTAPGWKGYRWYHLDWIMNHFHDIYIKNLIHLKSDKYCSGDLSPFSQLTTIKPLPLAFLSIFPPRNKLKWNLWPSSTTSIDIGQKSESSLCIHGQPCSPLPASLHVPTSQQSVSPTGRLGWSGDHLVSVHGKYQLVGFTWVRFKIKECYAHYVCFKLESNFL